MSSGRFGFSGRRGGGRRGGRDRGVVDSIREATGASVEDIQYQLQECEGDVNKATEQLIDSVPFTVVQSKKSRHKPQTRGRGRGRRDGSGGGRRGPEGETRGGRSTRRGGQNPRGRNFRNRDKTTPVEKDESTTTEKKKQIAPPPVPVKKAYLEALCRKPKFQPPTTTAVPSRTENGVESGWEEATPPPESYLHPIPIEVPPEEDPTSESEVIEETPVVVVEESFPLPMLDFRFTRADTTPIESSCLPIPMRLDLKAAGIPVLNADPLDMSDFQYLFGTFSGLQKISDSEDEISPVQQNLEEDPPVIPSSSVPVEEDSPVEEGTRTEEQDLPESLNSMGLRSGELEGRIQTQSSMEFPSEAQLNPSTVPLESYGSTTPPVEFRLDVGGAQVLDLEVQSPSHEKPNFLSTGVQSSPVSEEIPSSSNPEKANLPASVQVLEEVEYPPSKGFRGTDLKSMDISLSEDLTNAAGTSFEVTENRHKTPSIVETKTMMEPESGSYNITSGPTPTLPNYQPQSRHQPQASHKLPPPEKTVGGAPQPPNHQNSKYNSHQSSGGGGSNPIPGSGGTPNHVPVSLNPNNSSSSSGGNPSLPMMPQLPFVNPGMIPNPGMPVPPGHLYYPQYMQYQHQMYHGMYAGTYGGFGAPFNHESVGHPAHVNPAGVPPNQGNQQFPVSFPNALYTLGNSVYDMTPNNPNSFSNTKEKESVFLAQQQQLQHGFPGGHQPVPRNDGSLFYGMPGQAAFTQGIRSQYHQPPGFAGQFPGGGVVAPPPTYHPPGQQQNNFRLQ